VLVCVCVCVCPRARARHRALQEGKISYVLQIVGQATATTRNAGQNRLSVTVLGCPATPGPTWCSGRSGGSRESCRAPPECGLKLRSWALQAQATALQRVGRGGLNEAAADTGLLEVGGTRGDIVSGTEIVRHPSEAEQVQRMLLHQLNGLKSLPPAAGALACATHGPLSHASHGSCHWSAGQRVCHMPCVFQSLVLLILCNMPCVFQSLGLLVLCHMPCGFPSLGFLIQCDMTSEFWSWPPGSLRPC
jgi:hypothetical protein